MQRGNNVLVHRVLAVIPTEPMGVPYRAGQMQTSLSCGPQCMGGK